MIYVNKKLKYLFDLVPTAMIEENGVVNLASAIEEREATKLNKIVYSRCHEDEVKNIPYDEWDVIHKNGEYLDLRSENLELVIFKED